MAYNPYYQMGYQQYQLPQYQPYQSGYSQAAQGQMMTQNQPAQQMQPMQNYSPAINQSGIIWISGEQEAAMYPIAPNNAVALWEKSGKVIYLKQADATGKPTMTIYDLVERTESQQTVSGQNETTNTAYATKDELGAVVGVVKEFDDTLSNLKSEIEAIRGDLYGLAGKKKAKKQEVNDDE